MGYISPKANLKGMAGEPGTPLSETLKLLLTVVNVGVILFLLALVSFIFLAFVCQVVLDLVERFHALCM